MSPGLIQEEFIHHTGEKKNKSSEKQKLQGSDFFLQAA